MKNRSLSYYRHHRYRIIQHRLEIVQDIYGDNEYWMKKPNRLSKGKIHCTCWMCKGERFKVLPKHQEKSKLDAMKKDIQDYFDGNL